MTPLHTHERWRQSPVAGVLSDTLHALQPLLPEALARHLA